MVETSFPTPQLEAKPVDRWENEGGHLRAIPNPDEFGIKTIFTETFEVGGFRYTNRADAIAQARRMNPSPPAVVG
jgi:hypothetical protein